MIVGIQKCTPLLFIMCLLQLQLSAQQNDPFADIGNKAAAVRTHLLVQQPPPVLPEKQLPLQPGGVPFSPMNRLDTNEELQATLQQMRQKYVPFLAHKAPAVPETRLQLPLNQFNWRLETNADRQDFAQVLAGKGSWQSVSVPHYGPPLGKAATYYRTQFNLGEALLKKGALYIVCKAADYKAYVFVNGSYIGSHEGAFGTFEFDILPYSRPGNNSLLIKVENDYPMGGHVGEDGKKFDGDKVYASTGLGYDDPKLGWHHNPPGMGIYNRVYLEARSTIHVNDVFVRPLANTDTAEVWLEVNNTLVSSEPINVHHSLYGKNFEQTVYTQAVYNPETVHVPGVGDLVKPTDWERKTLLMGPGVNFLKFRIVIPGARRWKPDEPWLYELQLSIVQPNGNITDVASRHFGMRSFRMDTLASPKGALYLNDNFIRLRGANTMGSFMRNVKEEKWQQLIDDILLAKIAGMNYIRMTQFPVQQEVYDYCDQLGMMTQSDLPLFGVLRRNQWAECIRQVVELERHVRAHPCNIMVSYINERFPNAEGNPQRHFDTYQDFERFFTAADQAVLLHNPDRVIKAGDGDYDPPSPGLPDNHVYNGWYNGHGLGLGEMYKGHWLPVKPGWYYACGEFGSEGLDFYNTMQQYYPKNWLPQNAAAEKKWTPNAISMAQSFRFHYMWYPRQYSIQNWIKASHEHQAWVTRITTESFRRNNNLVSFAIHLFIDAWPAGWMKSIMDVNRQPKPAYFEYAHALAPLVVSLRADRHTYFSGDTISVETWIADDRNERQQQVNLRYQWEHNGKIITSGSAQANIEANNSQFQGFIKMVAPKNKVRSQMVLRVQLVDSKGTPIHESDFITEIFPIPKSGTSKVWIAGNTSGPARSIIQQLGLSVTDNIADASLLLIDQRAEYNAQQVLIDSLVEMGKTAVLLQPEAGKFLLAGDSITVTKTTMGQYYFVSPSLDHLAMQSFEPNDFKFWYNGNTDVVSPILSEMSEMKGWTSLAKTGQTGWVGANDYAYAAAEKKMGNGFFRINHIQLEGRVAFNPVARQFAMILLGIQ